MQANGTLSLRPVQFSVCVCVCVLNIPFIVSHTHDSPLNAHNFVVLLTKPLVFPSRLLLRLLFHERRC